VKLLKQNWIYLLHFLQNEKQLIEIVAHKVVTREASVLIDDEIKLLWVEQEIFIID
jgi:hypothetical protein